MNFYAFSGLLNGVAAALSGFLIYSLRPGDPKHQAYGIYCFSAAIWGFGYWAWHLSSTHDVALLFVRVLMSGAVFLPIAYLFHVVTLLDVFENHRKMLRIGWPLGIFFFIMNWTPYFIADVQAIGGFDFWPKPGPLFHPYLLWFGLSFIYGTWLLFQGARQRHGPERLRFYLLAAGSMIAYLGGMTNFPLWYEIPVPPNGAILMTVYTAVVAYTLVRYRLLDLGTAFERGITTTILMALVALPAFPILLLAQKWFWGTVNFSFSLVELMLLLALIYGASTLKGDLKTLITKALFKERYEQHATVRNFSKSLLSILELRDLTTAIVESICPILGIQWGVLCLRQSQGAEYHPRASFGKSLSELSEIQLSHSLPLEKIRTGGLGALTLHDIRLLSQKKDNPITIEILENLGTEICLPLINKNRLIGFCLFGPKNEGGTYSIQDLELLTTLSQEASVALDNALLYEELKRSQSLVRRTDRLRSLETMAGGLAHEIRNPLTSIKAFVDLAPERKDDEEFLARFSKVVREDVNRIERLTREILDYAKPTEPFLRSEDLNEIVEACLYTLRIRPSHELIVIETDLAHQLPKIFADRQQMKQVILNLFFNAVEAMAPNGGVLSVRTRRISSDVAQDWVQLEVQDTGRGIDPNDAEHIFDPFFTTKHLSQEHEGTGLGLAIAHQIIQEHQGKIEVHSLKGQGTTFFINLPSHPTGTTTRPNPASVDVTSESPTS
jgi:two-component system, NtrC family, sensor kinase